MGERVAERFAGQQFHDGIHHARGFAEIVDGQDVRMRERGDGPGFALESRARVGVGDDVGRKDFDRDMALELGVACAIDLTHPTGAKRCNYFIGAKPRTGC